LPRGRHTNKETPDEASEKPAPSTAEPRPRAQGGGPWGNQGVPPRPAGEQRRDGFFNGSGRFAAAMAQVLPDERELRRVIGDGEGLPDGEVEGLDEQDLIELYRGMVLLRTYDERSLVYHRQGRIGTYAIFWNHEAMQAGAVYALEREDWIFPSYRESAIGLLRGLPASTVLSWWRGHPAGWWNPLDYNVASICVPIGTHVPHATGLAWGMKLRGERACAIAFFGDGATSEGSFHEGANFAGVMRAPVVLFCNNNQWAISTPLSAQTAAETLADKAVGYGIPGVRVDGGDVLAVYEATREAVDRARAGDGPTFIEAVTYRTAPHATADDQTAYIDLERVEEEKRNECVGRYERYLRRVGVLSDELAETIRGEALETMREGIAAAEAEPAADTTLLFENTFANPPPSFDEELAELREILEP
jgi:pyruvate dehydrogenase E1 component alpha subunit